MHALQCVALGNTQHAACGGVGVDASAPAPLTAGIASSGARCRPFNELLACSRASLPARRLLHRGSISSRVAASPIC